MKMHCFCSVVPSEGHGDKYVCPGCGSQKLPASSSQEAQSQQRQQCHESTAGTFPEQTLTDSSMGYRDSYAGFDVAFKDDNSASVHGSDAEFSFQFEDELNDIQQVDVGPYCKDWIEKKGINVLHKKAISKLVEEHGIRGLFHLFYPKRFWSAVLSWTNERCRKGKKGNLKRLPLCPSWSGDCYVNPPFEFYR